MPYVVKCHNCERVLYHTDSLAESMAGRLTCESCHPTERNPNADRCPICGGRGPAISHTRCE